MYDLLWRRTDAQNVIYRIFIENSLRWSVYIINPVDKTF